MGVCGPPGGFVIGIGKKYSAHPSFGAARADDHVFPGRQQYARTFQDHVESMSFNPNSGGDGCHRPQTHARQTSMRSGDPFHPSGSQRCGARGNWRGFSPGTAVRHSQHTRVHTDVFLRTNIFIQQIFFFQKTRHSLFRGRVFSCQIFRAKRSSEHVGENEMSLLTGREQANVVRGDDLKVSPTEWSLKIQPWRT